MTIEELKNAIKAVRMPESEFKPLIYLVILTLKEYDERSTQSIARDLRYTEKQVLYGLADAEKYGLVVSRLDTREGKWWRLSARGKSVIGVLLAKVHGF